MIKYFLETLIDWNHRLRSYILWDIGGNRSFRVRRLINLPLSYMEDFLYFIKDNLYPYNVIDIKTLDVHWHDRDYVILHVAFQILVDFIELEDPQFICMVEPDERGVDYFNEVQELKRLYWWWINDYKNSDISMDMEDKLYELETQNLKSLMNLRKYLWT